MQLNASSRESLPLLRNGRSADECLLPSAVPATKGMVAAALSIGRLTGLTLSGPLRRPKKWQNGSYFCSWSKAVCSIPRGVWSENSDTSETIYVDESAYMTDEREPYPPQAIPMETHPGAAETRERFPLRYSPQVENAERTHRTCRYRLMVTWLCIRCQEDSSTR